ncbi:MAG: hypothetical protein JO086_12055 [Acidimicrobiia bacterium]|nr:hypothetical protein [Acidimicrobiia bacterium]
MSETQKARAAEAERALLGRLSAGELSLESLRTVALTDKYASRVPLERALRAMGYKRGTIEELFRVHHVRPRAKLAVLVGAKELVAELRGVPVPDRRVRSVLGGTDEDRVAPLFVE